MQAWAAPPADEAPTYTTMKIIFSFYRGNTPNSSCEWFGLDLAASKWVRLCCTPHVDAEPGEVSQSLTRDGVEYVHICAGHDCEPPRRFHGLYVPKTITVSWSTETFGSWPPWDWPSWVKARRGDYGTLWAAGLFDMPLLTCPKEWELT
jgi:hypothetical protein